MTELKERFADFTTPGFFSRVDSLHPLEIHIGLDEKGRKTIKLRSNFNSRSIKGTGSIDVRQFKSDNFSTIQFSLITDENATLFYHFCDDLIESTRNVIDVSLGYQAITNRYFQWKKLFDVSKYKKMPEQEIIGLICEIYFLREYLFNKFGKHEALVGWSGQELTHKDFSYDNRWYEVKSCAVGVTYVKIASIEQLQSPFIGELAIVYFEKMSSAFNGVTLNNLIKTTMNAFDSLEDRDDFILKVSLHGFIFHDYYDEDVYEIRDIARYEVKTNFPKITRDLIDPAIINAEYKLLIQDLNKYMISE